MNTNINGFNNNDQNTEPSLNVIPNMNHENNNNNVQNDIHEFDNAFINSLSNNQNNNNNNKFINNVINNNQNNDLPPEDELAELNKVIDIPKNKFINDNIDSTKNTLNDLNIESEHTEGPRVDYSKDPKVMENMQKKNTINIGSEGKIFLIIIIVLFLFIFGLPTVFDLIRNIRYR